MSRNYCVEKELGDERTIGVCENKANCEDERHWGDFAGGLS